MRDEEICMTGGFQTTGSQISVLSPDFCSSGSSNDMHFFTSYNPNISIYKPFVFIKDELDEVDKSKERAANNLSTKTKSLWEIHETRFSLYLNLKNGSFSFQLRNNLYLFAKIYM